MSYINLYNNLSYKIGTNDLNDEESCTLVECINKISDPDQKEMIYLLILHDYTLNNPNTKVIFPYKSKQLTPDSLEIKLDALPNNLKRILLKFVQLATIKNEAVGSGDVASTK